MKKKIFMVASFVVAISGAIATKAATMTNFVTKNNCSDSIVCPGGSVDCGYIQGQCHTVIQKKN